MGAADFDGDGGLDLAGLDGLGGRLTILRNFGRACTPDSEVVPDRPGTGFFESPKTFDLDVATIGTIVATRAAFFEDINADRVPDLVLFVKIGDPWENRRVVVTVLGERVPNTAPNLDNYSLGPTQLYEFPYDTDDWAGNPQAVLCDLDDDGVLDLALAATRAGHIVVMLGGKTDGRANGTFEMPFRCGGLDPEHVELDTIDSFVSGEFNGDGIRDLAMGGKYLIVPGEKPVFAWGVRILFGDPEPE
jgi:hypothetical protein